MNFLFKAQTQKMTPYARETTKTQKLIALRDQLYFISVGLLKVLASTMVLLYL